MISTLPETDGNLALLHAMRHHGYRGKIALTALTSRDAERLRASDADVILEPFSTATNAVLDMISRDAAAE